MTWHDIALHFIDTIELTNAVPTKYFRMSLVVQYVGIGQPLKPAVAYSDVFGVVRESNNITMQTARSAKAYQLCPLYVLVTTMQTTIIHT